MRNVAFITTLVISMFFPFFTANAATPTTGTNQEMTTTEQTKKQSEAFLETNKAKKGVIALPSGLQYEVITQGTGKKPTKNDIVTVDYEGKLINGKVFDSSYERGQPASFPVGGVIPGWTEALQMMPEGSTWMLYIPPTLAYGEAGAGGIIGPNETLIFKVHLISIK